MLKTILNMLAGALICAGVGAAFAVTGTAPLNGGGPALIDQSWLIGLAGGQNQTYQYGISAAGTTQATATALPNGIRLVEVDTTSASTGVNLPPCYQGGLLSIYNNGLQTLTVYPAVANNPTLSPAAQDTINNSTTTTQTTRTAKTYSCAKNGVWAAQ